MALQYVLWHVRYMDGGGVINNVRVRAMSMMEAMTKIMGEHPGCNIITVTEGFD